MSNHGDALELARKVTGNPNIFSIQPFIKIAGDPTLGLFLERIVYWSDKSGNDRLRQLKIFYKTADEWGEEIGFSYAQVTLARKKLEKMGFIQTSKKRVAGAPTIHYYANMDAIRQAIVDGYANLEKPEIQETSISENRETELKESQETEIQDSLSSLNNSSNSSRTSRSATKHRAPPAIPAYQVFVEEVGKYCLNRPQIKIIDQTVGRTDEALERWRESVRAWNLNGNKLTDAHGMLDWYKSGKRSNYQKGQSTNGTYQRHSNGTKFETGEHLDNEPTFDPYTGREIPAGGA